MEQTGLHALRLVVQASNNPDSKSLNNWADCSKNALRFANSDVDVNGLCKDVLLTTDPRASVIGLP